CASGGDPGGFVYW
nr:immunoglobulin heavy chain junction region [Mus musculus]MBK4198487.1 immunoglobulin heavy chain junction region [Mus musculus]MBK4198488.1 immunoglobulin heavy chain junction region [Mus musculus]MBK4198492.1 immunoglobulin heavy chain junction region [Mus musculus]MBK4198493.1 immunoglobulin heavy chain junction region [Mus musculus]